MNAIDLSEEALTVAQKNAKKHQVKIDFIQQDIQSLFHWKNQLDVIVSNPPYIHPSEKKEISLEPYHDSEGIQIIPRRNFAYDTLVIAVGSTINDFGIKGAKEHAIALDTPQQAERFHQKLHNAILRAQTQKEEVTPGQLEVVIVGAGATGVELAAELHKATREMTAYGLENISSAFAIIAIHAPFCYLIGITAMEIAKSKKPAIKELIITVSKAMFKNALVIAMIAGFIVNFYNISLPHTASVAIDMIVQVALPTAGLLPGCNPSKFGTRPVSPTIRILPKTMGSILPSL